MFNIVLFHQNYDNVLLHQKIQRQQKKILNINVYYLIILVHYLLNIITIERIRCLENKKLVIY